MRRITGLFTYPLKSGAAIAHDSCWLMPRGLEHDREWMVVDEEGTFVSQRTHPALARVLPTVTYELDTFPTGIFFTVRDNPFTPSPAFVFPDVDAPTRPVRVWSSTVDAHDHGDVAAEWFSDLLRKRVRLVRFAPESRRPTSRDPNAEVGFADGYPLLVTTQESLDDLNARLAVPVDSGRFRPNVVVSGSDRPYEEDEWAAFTLGGIPIVGVKKCVRCPIIQVDQSEGRRAGAEPTKTLLTYRRTVVQEDGKPVTKTWFGINANQQANGVLAVGDPVIVNRFADVPF